MLFNFLLLLLLFFFPLPPNKIIKNRSVKTNKSANANLFILKNHVSFMTNDMKLKTGYIIHFSNEYVSIMHCDDAFDERAVVKKMVSANVIHIEKSQFGRCFFYGLINLAGKLSTMMSILSVPPSPGVGGAFTLAAWNIRRGRNAGMTSVAKGLEQMGVGLAALTETKLTDDRYTRLASGFKILASKATSHNQGGIALLWKENHQEYEVESARIATPNPLLTFQFVTGNEQFFCMGIYTPPTDTMGVEDLRAAWEACPEGCIPLVLGDLNINFNEPRDKREEVIRDLLGNINLVDTSRQFTPHQPHQQSTRARWTWRHRREGRMHYSQPDYIFACERDAKWIRNVRFRWPQYHNLDHRVVIGTIRTGWRRLKEY
jgi:hypothetical protein